MMKSELPWLRTVRIRCDHVPSYSGQVVEEDVIEEATPEAL